jgi:putative aldouronate transport system substrate-binding protein
MSQLTSKAWVAVAAAAAVVVAGCSSGPAPAADLSTLTIMAPFLSATPPQPDDRVELAIEKALGTKLAITWAPNAQYEDKTNITLAGDDVPHVMVIGGKTSGFVKNARAGAFWDLTPYLDQYPNLKTYLPDVQRNASINGQVFGVFRARDVMRSTVIVRKDWLAKLGLPLPRTTEDLYRTAKAFATQDPDGNGKADTYGIILPKWTAGIASNSPYDAIETWFGAGNKWTERGGQLVPNFTTDEWMQALRFEKQLIAEHLVNPDYATFDPTKWNEPFVTGKGGMIIDVHSRVDELSKLLKKSDPANAEKYIDITGNLTGPDGALRAMPTNGYAGFLAVPKAKVRTEADLKAVLAILDKMDTMEVGVLISNGLEGVNFRLEDGKAVDISTTSAEATAVSESSKSFAQLGTNIAGKRYYDPKQSTEWQQQLYDKRRAIEESDTKAAVFDEAAPYISDTYTAKGAQLDNIMPDARLRFISGQLDEAGVAAAMEQWRRAGGTQVAEELNALAKKHG